MPASTAALTGAGRRLASRGCPRALCPSAPSRLSARCRHTRPGGPHHVQILVNLIDFGLGLQEAGDAARWQHAGSTDYDHQKMADGGCLSGERHPLGRDGRTQAPRARYPHRPRWLRWLPGDPVGCEEPRLSRRERKPQGRPGRRVLNRNHAVGRSLATDRCPPTRRTGGRQPPRGFEVDLWYYLLVVML